MAFQEIGPNLTPQELQKINTNFQQVQATFASISGEVLNEVITQAQLIWKEPVANFAALSTSYPTPEPGWTAMARDTGKVYRYNGTSWAEIQQIDAGPVNELDTRLTADLAETAKRTERIDFVAMLHENNEIPPKIYAKVISNRNIEVMVPFKGDLCAHYSFSKNPNDDYIIFNEGGVSEVNDKNESLKLKKNYDSNTGTWVTTSPPAYRASSVGATFTATFSGTGVDFKHWFDDRGGIWDFAIDGVFVKRISTHINAVPEDDIVSRIPNYAVRNVVRGLTQGEHTLVATFMGDDPSNIPSTGAGTGRGWTSYSATPGDDYETLRIYDKLKNPLKKFSVLQERSNKEFALSITPVGQPYRWIPEHESIGSAFAVSQQIFFDDVLVVDWTPDQFVREVKSVKIIQKMNGVHPNLPETPMAEILSIHTINSEGVSVKTKIKFLMNALVSGYGLMFPVKVGFASELITSSGKRYEAVKTDGSYDDIANSENFNSYAFLNKTGSNGEQNILVAMTIKDPQRTLRKDKTGRRIPLTWLQHRDTTVQKLYPQVYKNHNVLAGEVFEASGVFHIAELPFATDILPNEL